MQNKTLELQQAINKVWGICLGWKNPERFDDNPYDLATEIMNVIKDYQTYIIDSSK